MIAQRIRKLLSVEILTNQKRPEEIHKLTLFGVQLILHNQYFDLFVCTLKPLQ